MLNVLAQRIAKYGLQSLNRVGTKVPMARFQYFAFGANMDPAALLEKRIYPRTSVAAVVANVRIEITSPCEFIGKGFASLEEKGGAEVHGVVHDISWLEGLILDVMEWVPFRFHERVRGVARTTDGRDTKVFYYVACSPKVGLSTSQGYRDMLVKAAERYAFPEQYIAQLKALPVADGFAIDHGFRLSNPALRRWRERELLRLYRIHDEMREKLCRVLP
jgi:hypothetical protein